MIPLENVKISVNKNELTITVDLTHESAPSKSGKTTTVASTKGFVSVPEHEGIAVSLNVNKRH